MLFRALYFLKISHAQQRIMRRNHHRRLIIHSCIFYSIWLSLWSPVMFLIYLDIYTINEWIVFAASVANTVETLLDPFISVFLDKRFARAWKTSFIWMKGKVDHLTNTRVNPVV
jgi:hypothetical protein